MSEVIEVIGYQLWRVVLWPYLAGRLGKDSLLPNLSRPRLWRMWGVEMTAQRKAELEQLFEQGYRAIGVMERHLGGRTFFVGDRPTIADVALYVYPRLCSEGGYDLGGFPAVRAWLERIATLPGYLPPPR